MATGTITIRKEISLEDFEAWSGGKDVLNAILEHEEKDVILDLLTNIINDTDGTVTETEVNDFLWFTSYDIVEDYLGISLFD